jgi:hypothetical protein
MNHSAALEAKYRRWLHKSEAACKPRTVVISGGAPALEAPNCIGSGAGDCPEQWCIDPKAILKNNWSILIDQHEMTHLSRAQAKKLIAIRVKRALIDLHACHNDTCSECGQPWPCRTAEILVGERERVRASEAGRNYVRGRG